MLLDKKVWNALLFRDAIIAHALPRLPELAQHILPRQIAGAEHSGADCEVCAVAPEPATRSLYHVDG